MDLGIERLLDDQRRSLAGDEHRQGQPDCEQEHAAEDGSGNAERPFVGGVGCPEHAHQDEASVRCWDASGVGCCERNELDEEEGRHERPTWQSFERGEPTETGICGS